MRATESEKLLWPLSHSGGGLGGLVGRQVSTVTVSRAYEWLYSTTGTSMSTTRLQGMTEDLGRELHAPHAHVTYHSAGKLCHHECSVQRSSNKGVSRNCYRRRDSESVILTRMTSEVTE